MVYVWCSDDIVYSQCINHIHVLLNTVWVCMPRLMSLYTCGDNNCRNKLPLINVWEMPIYPTLNKNINKIRNVIIDKHYLKYLVHVLLWGSKKCILVSLHYLFRSDKTSKYPTLSMCASIKLEGRIC